MGISPEDAEQLFRPFAQLDASTSRRFGGTGLGLAICRRLAALMEGDVVYLPGREGGSIFRVTARLDRPTSGVSTGDMERILREGSSARTEPRAAVRDLRILIVDDNAVNLRVAAAMLKRIGYPSDSATNGQEALAALDRQPYDLVLMDLEMPEMDGAEATRRIRANLPKDRQPYIAGVSAHALASYREKSLAVGMNDYVTKRLMLSDVEGLVARHLAAREIAQ